MTASKESSAIEMPSQTDYKVETASGIFSSLNLSKPKKICFVCTGNTCRSPMAAALANELGKNAGIVAVSAGLYPEVGKTISENALFALLDAGYKPSPLNPFDKHTATSITEEIIASCDTVVGITESHMMTLIHTFPSYAQKFTSMPKNISDPYGGSLDIYKICLYEIEKGVKELLKIGNPEG